MSSYVDIHTHRDQSLQSVISIRSFRFGIEEIPLDRELVSAAIHPWDAAAMRSELNRFEECLDRFVMMSEIGLDSLHSDYDLQKELFEKQMDIAERRAKSVVIHTVRAHQDTLAIVKKYPKITKIIHSFVGSKQIAAEYINAGCYLSFSPISLRSPKSVDALLSIPSDRIFFESDDSSLAIETIYRTGANILGVDIEQLKESIFNSYSRVCLIHAQSC